MLVQKISQDPRAPSIEGDLDGNRITLGEYGPKGDLSGARITLVGRGNTLIIGRNVRWKGVLFLKAGASVIIGDGCHALGANIYAHEGSRAEFGEDCLLSHSVVVRPSDAHKIFDRSSNKRVNDPGRVLVGNRVWIGERAYLGRNARIPSGCVVGFGAFVGKAYDEPNAVMAGVPAKVVRRDVRWEA